MRHALSLPGTRESGLFARHEAIASGLSEIEFRDLTRGPASPWVRVRYGVYVDRGRWESLDDSGRRLMFDEAALIVCDEGTALSHTSAARRLGLDVLGDDGLAHVTRFRVGGRRLNRVQAGIKHHCARLEDAEIVMLGGLRVTVAARTVIDMTTEFGVLSGIVIGDSALRAGLTQGELATAMDGRAFDPNAPALKQVVTGVRPGADSALESISRFQLERIGIDDLVLQYAIWLSSTYEARVDLFSPRLHHVFECDGRLKYVDDPETGTVAAETLWREKRREDAIRGLGFGLTRLTWSDVQPGQEARLRARVRQEVALQSGGHRSAG